MQIPCTHRTRPTKVRSFGIASVLIGPGRLMKGSQDNRHAKTSPQATEGGKLSGVASGVPRKNPCEDPAAQGVMDRVRVLSARPSASCRQSDSEDERCERTVGNRAV